MTDFFKRPAKIRFLPKLDDYREDRRLTRRKAPSGESENYDDLMSKFVKGQKELEFYKRRRFQDSSIYEELNEPIEACFSIQPPSGFNANNQESVVKTPLEEMMERLEAQQKEFLHKTDERMGALENNVMAIGNSVIILTEKVHVLETQVEQLASAQVTMNKPGEISSNTEPNPNIQHDLSLEIRSGAREINYGPEIEDQSEKESGPDECFFIQLPTPPIEVCEHCISKYLNSKSDDVDGLDNAYGAKMGYFHNLDAGREYSGERDTGGLYEKVRGKYVEIDDPIETPNIELKPWPDQG